MDHHCGTRLVITHRCALLQSTWCPKCRTVKHQPKRQPGGARTLPTGVFLKCVAAVYNANKEEGMRLREAINIVEAAYIRHKHHSPAVINDYVEGWNK